MSYPVICINGTLFNASTANETVTEDGINGIWQDGEMWVDGEMYFCEPPTPLW
jgi:hypothetical protein